MKPFIRFYVWTNIYYLKMFHKRRYFVCIYLVRETKFIHTFVPNSQNFIHVGLLTV